MINECKWVSFLLVLVCVFGMSTISAAEPTLEETITYINERLVRCMAEYTESPAPNFKIKYNVGNKVMLEDVDTLRIEENKVSVWYYSHNKTSNALRTQSVNLIKLNELFFPVYVSHNETYSTIGFSCHREGCIRANWVITDLGDDDDEPNKGDGLFKRTTLDTCSNETMVNKIAKAFNHVIKISGGNEDKELF